MDKPEFQIANLMVLSRYIGIILSGKYLEKVESMFRYNSGVFSLPFQGALYIGIILSPAAPDEESIMPLRTILWRFFTSFKNDIYFPFYETITI